MVLRVVERHDLFGKGLKRIVRIGKRRKCVLYVACEYLFVFGGQEEKALYLRHLVKRKVCGKCRHKRFAD